MAFSSQCSRECVKRDLETGIVTSQQCYSPTERSHKLALDSDLLKCCMEGRVRGPMQDLKELWTQADTPETRNTYQYVLDLRNRLEKTYQLARDCMKLRVCTSTTMTGRPRTVSSRLVKGFGAVAHGSQQAVTSVERPI